MEQRVIFRNTMDPRVCESSSRLKICIYIYVYRDRMNNSLLFLGKACSSNHFSGRYLFLGENTRFTNSLHRLTNFNICCEVLGDASVHTQRFILS